MHGTVHYDRKQKLLLLSFHGVITEPAVLDLSSAAREFTLQNEVDFSITDTSAVTEIKIDAEFIRRFVGSRPVLPPYQLRAVVAPSDAVFGLCRLFFFHRDPDSEQTFIVRSMGEAYEALGITGTELELVAEVPAKGGS